MNTAAVRFLNERLHSEVYRRAHNIEPLREEVSRTMQECELLVAVFLRYYDGPRGIRLGLFALLQSDANDPASCIQGDMARGTNEALRLCRRVGLNLIEVCPVSHTTNLSGIYITKGVPVL